MSDMFSSVSDADLIKGLKNAVAKHHELEAKLSVCLCEIQERCGYRDFGFSNVYDYAEERFGFDRHRTRHLLSLGPKLEKRDKT